MQFPKDPEKSTRPIFPDIYNPTLDYSNFNPSSSSDPRGSSTLEDDKVEPKNPVKVGSTTSLLTVLLNINIQEFSKKHELVLVEVLSEITGVKESYIHLFSIESGSVKVTFEFPLIIVEALQSLVLKLLQIHPKTKDFNLVSISSSEIYASAPHRILYLAANPIDQGRIRTDEEFKLIQRSLDGSENRDAFRLQVLLAAQAEDIQEAILRYKPNIVHISGHGSSSGEWLVESKDGLGHPIPPQALGKILGIARRSINIQCVILNLCYSEEQAKEIAKHIDCVICTSGSITDDAAKHFSSAFYQGIASEGFSVNDAYEWGRVRLEFKTSGHNDHEHLILLTRGNSAELVFVPIEKDQKQSQSVLAQRSRISDQKQSETTSTSTLSTLPNLQNIIEPTPKAHQYPASQDVQIKLSEERFREFQSQAKSGDSVKLIKDMQNLTGATVKDGLQFSKDLTHLSEAELHEKYVSGSARSSL